MLFMMLKGILFVFATVRAIGTVFCCFSCRKRTDIISWHQKVKGRVLLFSYLKATFIKGYTLFSEF